MGAACGVKSWQPIGRLEQIENENDDDKEDCLKHRGVLCRVGLSRNPGSDGASLDQELGFRFSLQVAAGPGNDCPD
jgi:hypothetical protein